MPHRPENKDEWKMWHDAWKHIGPCPQQDEKEEGFVQVEPTNFEPTSLAPITSSPAETGTTTNNNLPICPSRYSTTIKYIIWRCN